MVGLNIFKPDWKHSNVRVRREAVGNITDQTVLGEIARSDKAKFIREIAVGNITDQTVLGEIAKIDDQELVRRAAVARITDQTVLGEIATSDRDTFVRINAVGKITDQTVLGEIAKNITENNVHFLVRENAVARITDHTVLEELAKNDRDRFVRERAVDRVNNIKGSLVVIFFDVFVISVCSIIVIIYSFFWIDISLDSAQTSYDNSYTTAAGFIYLITFLSTIIWPFIVIMFPIVIFEKELIAFSDYIYGNNKLDSILDSKLGSMLDSKLVYMLVFCLHSLMFFLVLMLIPATIGLYMYIQETGFSLTE